MADGRFLGDIDEYVSDFELLDEPARAEAWDRAKEYFRTMYIAMYDAVNQHPGASKEPIKGLSVAYDQQGHAYLAFDDPNEDLVLEVLESVCAEARARRNARKRVCYGLYNVKGRGQAFK